uniref:Uncharacterized protein n=1 Tax=Rhizophora mucronata TaxID=61149 RepID=A0A2P2NHS5_RHIMU
MVILVVSFLPLMYMSVILNVYQVRPLCSLVRPYRSCLELHFH